MPEMNGIELADMLARLHGEVAVLLTTGDPSMPAEAGDPSRVILIKPYSLDTLKQTIDRCLAARAATGG